jgi:carbon storage regulator CsrA
MLVLTGMDTQTFSIGPDIVVTVVRVGHGRVQLGFDAPQELRISRSPNPKKGPTENAGIQLQKGGHRRKKNR